MSARINYQHRPLPRSEEEWIERAREQLSRFLSKIKKIEGGCWEWIGGKDKDGYGKFAITGRGQRFPGDSPVQKHVRAHRLMWLLKCGPIPKRLKVLHECDNTSFVRPKHLSLGTQKQNVQDAISRGRALVGELNPRATLTTKDVVRIRRLSKRWSQTAVARIVGCSRGAVSAVLTGRTWCHV